MRWIWKPGVAFLVVFLQIHVQEVEQHQPGVTALLPCLPAGCSSAGSLGIAPATCPPKGNTKTGDLCTSGLLTDTKDWFSTFISMLGIGGLKCHYLLIVLFFMQPPCKHYTSQQTTVNKNC